MLASGHPEAGNMAAYALTIFIGAFLLFQVQPLIGKFILPWFGGGPGVWTTCMLFFQLLLVGGYAYAHLTTRHLKPRSQAALHVCLMIASLFLLPIIPAEAWKPSPGGDPTWRILVLLTATVGLPYFVLSTTGPLVQRWFSLANPGVSPYRLYALSNVGSLLALISYPFVFEPMLTRRDQANFWSAGLGIFILSCSYCAWKLMRLDNPIANPASSDETLSETNAPYPPLSTRLLWLLLPACASAYLLAATNKICQDIAVIPFLWVVPLAIYLISFIISFDNPRWYSRRVFGILYVGGLALIFAVLYQKHNLSIQKQIGGHALVLFVCCMICHGELYRLKPHPRYLTNFYLMISIGGALGGLFVAVVAPLIFIDYYEFQFGLLACGFALLWIVLRTPAELLSRRDMLRNTAWLLSALMVTAMALIMEVQTSRKDAVAGARNFYGVLTVFEYQKDKLDSHYYMLQHGRITHGMQFTEEQARRWATTYYAEKSGVGLAMRHFPRQSGQRIGLVGLGTGTMAAYGKAGDYLRVYEINPLVKDLSATTFTYLKDCPAKVEVVMGDARLSMEHEPSQQLDILVLDAFSSDAIPVHLLTREAFEIYRRHLKPDGVIAVHVSNRHLDLRPVVLNLAEHFKMETATIESDDGDDDWWVYSSTWVLVTNNHEFLQQSEIDLAKSDDKAKRKPIRLWTDDYSALFQVVQ